MRFFVVLLLAGCATTRSTCPANTKLVTVHDRDRKAQWCATTLRPQTPVVGDAASTYADTLSAGARPIGFSGGVEGPFASWYPDGKQAARGNYLDFGSRSVPDGVWQFWNPDGKPRTIGAYRRGEPAGCFAGREWRAQHGLHGRRPAACRQLHAAR